VGYIYIYQKENKTVIYKRTTRIREFRVENVTKPTTASDLTACGHRTGRTPCVLLNEKTSCRAFFWGFEAVPEAPPPATAADGFCYDWTSRSRTGNLKLDSPVRPTDDTCLRLSAYNINCLAHARSHVHTRTCTRVILLRVRLNVVFHKCVSSRSIPSAFCSSFPRSFWKAAWCWTKLSARCEFTNCAHACRRRGYVRKTLNNTFGFH